MMTTSVGAAVSNDNGVAGRDNDEEKIEELSSCLTNDCDEDSHQEATNDEKQHKEEEVELTWLDSQSSINDLTKEINNNNNSTSDSRAPRRRLRLKIIQTFREEELTLDGLLESLGGSDGSSDLKSLTLLGVSVDGTLADKLAPVLKKQIGLTNFSLHKLLPSGILPLCAALKGHRVLRELRLHLSPTTTDDEDPATSLQVCTLFETLASLPKLEVLKLSGFAFNAQSTRSAATLLSQASSTIADLRITSCTNVNLAALAKAIQHSNSVRYLDFSMNDLCDHRALSVLLQIPSIQELILSDNEFGGGQQGYDDVENALRCNTTLQRLEMDMNPLSEPFCRGLERALEHDNVTLEYIWLLSRFSDASAAAELIHRRLDYYCDLNAAGRRLWRGNNAVPYYETLLPKLLPHVLEATTLAPAMLFGLLREDAALAVSGTPLERH